MVLTLWTSRKAMHVTETEISLSAQSSDDESQYGSNVFSRGIVRLSINAATPSNASRRSRSASSWRDASNTSTSSIAARLTT